MQRLLIADGARIKDVQQVVVTARRELIATRAPLQATNLLLVNLERRGAMLANANVVNHDVVITTTRCKLRTVPRDRTHPRGVTSQRTHLLALRRVPNLNLRAVRTHRNVLTVRTPVDGGDVIIFVIRVGLAQLVDSPSIRVPHVHGAPQRHRDLVRRPPVDKVQIVVIDQLRRI